jgi:hypothetical protein
LHSIEQETVRAEVSKPAREPFDTSGRTVVGAAALFVQSNAKPYEQRFMALMPNDGDGMPRSNEKIPLAGDMFECIHRVDAYRILERTRTMDHYTSLLANTLANGASLEEALSSLRARGATPVEVIKAIHVARGISLGEAVSSVG